MSQTILEEEEPYRENVLFECARCGKYYVLYVEMDEQKQDCPQNAGHGIMAPTRNKSDRGTCANDKCSSFLGTAVGIDRCDQCRKPLVPLRNLDVSQLPVSESTEEAEKLPGALRTLQGKIEQHGDFTTSHHDKATSKGTKKTGTSQAKERDSQADGADRVHKDKMARFLNDALAGAIEWKLKQERQGGLSKADEKKYTELKGKATALINRFGGTAVTED